MASVTVLQWEGDGNLRIMKEEERNWNEGRKRIVTVANGEKELPSYSGFIGNERAYSQI